MKLLHISGGACRAALASVLLCSSVALAGCGMPGAPQPPSLNLPNPVTDLSAVRAGDKVSLTWTLPKRTTDKVALNAPINVRICRNEDAAADCNAVTTLQLFPGSDGAFTDALPSPLASGSLHQLTYFVELVNRKGRSAGPSNRAEVLAGEAPAAVAGLNAEPRKDGVLLQWTPTSPDSPAAVIRFQRTLTTPAAKSSSRDSLAARAEPPLRILLVEAGSSTDRALDKDIHFGETYEYRAQRVVRRTIDGHTLELASALSPPVRLDTADIFPPSVPRGLAAVATAGDNGGAPAVDLSWQPDTDANLLGYIVYRREPGEVAAWQRISSMQPVIGPGFHDSNVQAGHTYMYAVSAIAQNGHESTRSAEAQETVPLQ